VTARAAAVILAAGSGTRLGARAGDSPLNKVLLPVAGVPILARSVRTVLEVVGVHRIVLVVRPEDRDAVREAVAPHLGAHDLWVVDGGVQRHDSEWQALRTLAADIEDDELDVVAIHDAARPLATQSLWRRVIDTAAEHGGAIPVCPVPRLSRRDGSRAPAGLVGVQTPQAFRARDLLEAHRRANAEGFIGTDTAACLEHYSDYAVYGVPSTTANLKVTFPEDIALAETLLTAPS
jgi:2-C-methyl-D-erythritol 4-phosphate cytidylyltransferase